MDKFINFIKYHSWGIAALITFTLGIGKVIELHKMIIIISFWVTVAWVLATMLRERKPISVEADEEFCGEEDEDDLYETTISSDTSGSHYRSTITSDCDDVLEDILDTDEEEYWEDDPSEELDDIASEYDVDDEVEDETSSIGTLGEVLQEAISLTRGGDGTQVEETKIDAKDTSSYIDEQMNNRECWKSVEPEPVQETPSRSYDSEPATDYSSSSSSSWGSSDSGGSDFGGSDD